MSNVFSKWCSLKEKLENRKKLPYFKNREIWWAYPGKNIAYEEDGKGDNFTRPILIFHKFNKNLLLAIPQSKQIKKHPYIWVYDHTDEKRALLILQMRVISSKRLIKKMATLPRDKFDKLVKEMNNSILQLPNAPQNTNPPCQRQGGRSPKAVRV